MTDSTLDNPVTMGWAQSKELALPTSQDRNKDTSVWTQLPSTPGEPTGAEAQGFLS